MTHQKNGQNPRVITAIILYVLQVKVLYVAQLALVMSGDHRKQQNAHGSSSKSLVIFKKNNHSQHQISSSFKGRAGLDKKRLGNTSKNKINNLCLLITSLGGCDGF
jgi:hypothetical protein